MDNDIMPTEYLFKSIKGIIYLCIYWGVVYFIYTSTFKDNTISLEHLLGTIEFISAIAIIIYLILFLSSIFSKFLGCAPIGILLSLIVLVVICLYGDEFMRNHNISDSVLNYFFLAIGIIINISLLSKIILNIKYYILKKQLMSLEKKKEDENFNLHIQ